MAQKKTGTFSATGESEVIIAKEVRIGMTFAGTATVKIQWQLDGTNWRDIESFTSWTEEKIIDARRIPVRLSCTAHTDNVTYVMSGD